MSYAVVEDVAVSWESYEHVASDLDGSLPDGLILHAAGRTDEGVRIIEVWESEEAWRRFVEGDHRLDDRFSTAPRYVRDLRATHLVLGRGDMTSIPETEAGCSAEGRAVNFDLRASGRTQR